MEKSLNQWVRETFSLEERDIRTYSPLTLAYIGDGVFDLIIRSLVVDRGNTSANRLHYHTSHIVRAKSQAKMASVLLEDLTEEEADIYRRGRNAKPHTMAKNATVADYRSATGLEALLGYLYLLDRTERIMELTKTALERCELTY